MGHARIAVVALCGVIGLAGCGGDDDGGETPENRADTPAATSAPEETAAGSATEEPAASEEVVAEQTVRSRTQATTTIDIAVQSLRVEGELAELVLTFTPHDTDPESWDDTTSITDLHATGGGSTPFVTLVDTVNLKRYVVVNDSEDNELETNLDITRPELDSPATSTHTFAAPPPDVTEIDVSVGDWPTFHDVPIER
jgi:hypothetical protein